MLLKLKYLYFTDLMNKDCPFFHAMSKLKMVVDQFYF